MRRKRKAVPNPKSRAFVYTCSILALSIYAIPKIPKLQPGLAGTFSSAWILFAALAVASNLYFLIGADKERSRFLELGSDNGSGAPTATTRTKELQGRRRAH